MNHFGTDGIRAKAEVFTKSYIEKIAKAALMVEPGATAIIGRDTRESGFFIETKLSQAIAENGGKAIVAGMTATPAIAYLARKLGCDYGIMISASHNPPEYNGIKFFSGSGEKIDENIEEKIDYHIDNPVEFEKAYGTREQIDFYYGDDEYINFLIDTFKPDLKGMRICLDCANGATARIAPMLFSALGAQVTVFNKNETGKDINKNCGTTHIEFLMEKMKKENFDIGFAYDGDGDRVKAVCENKLFDGDHLMYVHAQIMKKHNKLANNTVVGTLMSNMGTQRAYEKAGINFVRTDVGDKYVYREMRQKGYNLGGEESGHIIFSDYMKTGDGILSSLLTAMLAKEYSLVKLDDIIEYPKAIDSYICGEEAKKRFFEDEILQAYLKEVDFEGRMVVRPSGTEPKIRILVEAVDKSVAEDKAAEIKNNLIWRLE